MKNKTANENRCPGRPAYEPKFPRSLEWTFADFMEANEVNPETGKGPKCSKLTLTKYLDRDMYHPIESGKYKGKPDRNRPRKNSLVVKSDKTREPNSESGLGRKTFVFYLRAKQDSIKPAKVSVKVGTAAAKPHKARKAHTVSESTADYEAQKAALLAPITAVTITPEVAPVAETAPEVVPVSEVTPEITAEPVTAEAAQTVEPVAA